MAVRAALADPGAPGALAASGLLAHELGVLAYGLVAILAWRAYRRSVRGELAWLLTIIAFVALAINQQFGLIEFIVDVVRGLSREQSWYRERRPVQREFILGIAACGAGALVVLLVALRREAWQLRLAALVAVGLLAFALIRAVSLHGLDALFGRALLPPLPLTLGNMIELAGLLLAALACLAVMPPRRSRRSRPEGRPRNI